jgi:hypothetical protein
LREHRQAGGRIGPVVLPPASLPQPAAATLTSKKAHGKTVWYLHITDADTGRVLADIRSPSQPPSYHNLQVTAQDTSGDGAALFVLSASKGKKTVAVTFAV